MTKDQELPEPTQDEQLDATPAETCATAENAAEQADNEAEPETEALIAELTQKLQQAEQKANENWDKAVRMQAEMENLKKRTQKDLEGAHKFALEGFTKELLPVIDSLELGLKAATGDSEEVKKFREGSELTLKQFAAAFTKYNIEVLDPLGQPFNPELHQAMAMQPSAEVQPNTVLNVFQKGYTLNGRLLRPAMVVVARQQEKPAPETPKIDEQA
ncbi:MAG: nucleotide exchange factor GrpE [Gammaproteobacteria bacterium HGW-Gammaproteobacteria-3]|jgi:molecular chaperone GrpE|nr:MAG: nucleotide exchange factor GrpE [Gammaproteobacteria bacterium HGW-Gammaproteobacteria-3]